MANPFPFVAGSVLTAAELNGIGETTSFTPTWSGLTVGNGTLNYATYVRVQNLVYVQIYFILGSTSAITGNIYFTAPVAGVASQGVMGNVTFYDANTTANYYGICSQSGQFIQLFPVNASATYATAGAASATVPMTWASTDQIQLSCVYRVA